MKITENFQAGEFACKDKARTPYPSKWIDSRLHPLCEVLEKIRGKVGRALVIKSGYRTPDHNAKQPGAAKNSQHMKGTAADFRCVNSKGTVFIGPRQLYQIVEKMIKDGEIPDGGLGSYPAHVHYDIGPAGRRWKI